MNAIREAAEAVHAAQVGAYYATTPDEIAEIIKRELEKAVPAKPEPPRNQFWDYTAHRNHGHNECRKRLLGGG